MKYKPSLYNICDINSQNQLLIINGLYNSHLKFNEKDSQIVKHILDGNININTLSKKQSEIAYQLIRAGFLVDKSEDESLLADYKHNKLVYGGHNLILTVIPTNSCNLKCRYCYESDGCQYLSRDNCDSLLLYIKENIKYYNSLTISFFGGEPLVGYQILLYLMEQLSLISKKFKKPIIAGMTTNGVLLTKERLETLIKYGVVYYQITLDGFKNIHDKNRPTKNGESSYEAIYRNLLEAKNIKKRFGIIIRSNIVYEDRYKSIPFIEKIKNDFLNDNRFVLQLQNVKQWGGDSIKQINTKPLSEYEDFFDEVISLGVDPFGMINTIEDLSNVCAAGKNNAFFIDYDLSVRRCSLPIYDNSPFNRYNNIGFIEKNGKMVLNKNYLAKWCQCKSVPEDCLKCKYYAFCFSCVCPYSVLKGKRECEDFRFMVDFKLKIWNSTCKGRGNA